jgi:hypothetical protein
MGSADHAMAWVLLVAVGKKLNPHWSFLAIHREHRQTIRHNLSRSHYESDKKMTKA